VDTTVLPRIRRLLEKESVAFREVCHEPTFTSEQSAEARGEDIRVGAKALVLKLKDNYCLFVFSAARRLDSGRVRKKLGVTKLRFATKEELGELTGLVPGSVPPFGEPILPFSLFADPSLLENDRIAFNAGSLTHSIIMGAADWQQIARPEVFSFTVPL
jgi:Ala-tRNA(Pro) deacylase